MANPTDLVKVRLQAEGKLPPGVPRRYSGSLNAYSTIVKQVSHPVNIFQFLFIFSVIFFNCSKFRKELGLCGLDLGLTLHEMLL